MRRTLIVTLTDEQLLDLLKAILDEDKEEALRFLQTHLRERVRAVLEGEGHCRPYFEISGRSAVPSQFGKPEGKH